MIVNQIDEDVGWGWENPEDKQVVLEAALYCKKDPGAGFCEADSGAHALIMGYMDPETSGVGVGKAQAIHMLSTWLPLAKSCTFTLIERSDDQECVPYSEW